MNYIKVTQAEYDAMVKDSETYYWIKGTMKIFKGEIRINPEYPWEDYEPEIPYLCFTAQEDTDISLTTTGTLTSKPVLKYAINNVDNWQSYTLGNTISLNEGDKCYWHGYSSTFSEASNKYIRFNSSRKVAASGEVNSLIDWGNLTDFCFYNLFSSCTMLTKAPELPATTLATYCYYGMFAECTSITEAPELPATTLANYCYQNMFRACISLIEPPELPATTLATSCYNSMFSGCSSLIETPELPAIELVPEGKAGQYTYQYMFKDCVSLTKPAELPATKLVSNCYAGMFQGCINIRLSTTQSDIYKTPYRIPKEGQGPIAGTYTTGMFSGTGGSFTGNPVISRIYYGAWD